MAPLPEFLEQANYLPTASIPKDAELDVIVNGRATLYIYLTAQGKVNTLLRAKKKVILERNAGLQKPDGVMLDRLAEVDLLNPHKPADKIRFDRQLSMDADRHPTALRITGTPAHLRTLSYDLARFEEPTLRQRKNSKQ